MNQLVMFTKPFVLIRHFEAHTAAVAARLCWTVFLQLMCKAVAETHT